MSNFLQRVAATAAPANSLATPRLQPVLGSVFASSVPLLRAATGPANRWETNAETEAAREKIERVSGISDRLFPSTHASWSSPDSALPVARLTHSSEPPLLTGDYGSDPTSQARPDGNRQPENSNVSRWSQNSRGEESVRGSETRPLETADSAPLSRAGRVHPQQRLTPIPMQAVQAAPPPRLNALGRASAQRVEPDEIHIHIGRIEVAAITPQPQQVAAPRKGINLDEYLRRGSGGQR